MSIAFQDTHSTSNHQALQYNPPNQRPTQALAPQSTKPPISQARLLANRANAKKSTGPRTHEGKQKVSKNALKHGLTAQTHCFELTSSPRTPENQPLSTQHSPSSLNPEPQTSSPLPAPLPSSLLLHPSSLPKHDCPQSAHHQAECPATYQTFINEFKQELRPITVLQITLFYQLAPLAWRLKRLPHTEQQIFHAMTQISTKPQPPSSLPTAHCLPPTPPPPPCDTLAQAFLSQNPNNPFLLFNRYERSLQNAFLRVLKQYHALKKSNPNRPSEQLETYETNSQEAQDPDFDYNFQTDNDPPHPQAPTPLPNKPNQSHPTPKPPLHNQTNPSSAMNNGQLTMDTPQQRTTDNGQRTTDNNI